jgi:hypothetical protein
MKNDRFYNGIYHFYLGETVTFTVEIRTRIGGSVLFDPSSIKITINPETSGVHAVNMNKIVDGRYFYDWISNGKGVYEVTYEAISSNKISMQKDKIAII